MSFPFGPMQIFVYGEGEDELTVTISESDFEFAANKGGGSDDGFLNFLGYDRHDDPEYLAQIALNSSGAAVWDGPSFVIPQIFEWRLQLLTEEKHETLWAMFALQQRQKQPITLLDFRLAMREAAPKVRAAAAVDPAVEMDSPTIAGIDFFWAQFQIQLEMGERGHFFKGEDGELLYELSMSAKEMLPDG